MGKLRWVPLLILIALLASDAAAAESSTALVAPRHPSPACDVVASPTGDTLLGDTGGGGGLGGLSGDPDDLIDGNRAKPKPGISGIAGTGSSPSTTVLWMRLYDYVLMLCQF